MGLCLSRKKRASPPPDAVSECIPNERKVERKNEKQIEVAAEPEAKVAAETKPVFVITQTSKRNTTAEEHTPDGSGGDRSPSVVDVTPAPVRTSSCTKEEVDAILIHCGRLSRSSSGNASNQNDGGGGGGHRKYSGSKRSYDFDNGKKGDEEEREKPISRPSPQRRTPGRERSGIGERNSDGGRRVSRSPRRRSEGPTPCGSASDRSRQPARMVSIPAREKAGVSSYSVADKSGGERRSASPRPRSPANTTRTGNENALHHDPQPQSLSPRTSSSKAEQSPSRRNPMAEIDDNSLGGNQNGSNKYTKEWNEGVRKPRRSQTQKARVNVARMRKSDGGAMEVSNGLRRNNVISNTVREQLMSCRAKVLDGEAPSAIVGVESLNPRTIARSGSPKTSSRDFDQSTSSLLEDIHNHHHHHHHHHHQSTAFSLPACFSKACSILDPVTDLDSSFSENKSSRTQGSDSSNCSLRRRFGRKGEFVKDDPMEPSSLHKYVSVRDLGGEMEPQESAGSDIFVGRPWSSPLEPNSIDSTDRDWTSYSNNGEEVEQQWRQSMPEIALRSEARGRKPRGGGSSSNSLPTAISSGRKKREFDHHHQRRHGRGGFGGGSAAKAGGSTRSLSLPLAAASS